MKLAFSAYREKITGFLSKKGSSADACVGIEDVHYIVIDTELTGLDTKKDSIISIGAIRMFGGRIDLGNVFYRVVNPSTAISPESIVIHEITPSEAKQGPPIKPIIQELAGLCRDDVIVGHFIHLDMDFINAESRRVNGGIMKNSVVDTHKIHEWLKENNGEFRKHYRGFSEETNLFALAKKYRIPFSEAHNALNDAFITAQLFQRFLSFLPGLGVMTLRDLIRIGKP